MTEDDYSQNLEDDITNLLVAISAEGIGEVDMDQLKTDLQNMGYTIDTKSLFNIVSNLPVVSNASYNKIELVTDVDTSGDDPAQDTEDDDQKTVDVLMDEANQKNQLTINLKDQLIVLEDGNTIEFQIDPFRKKCLLEGLDDIGLTLQKKEKIDQYEASLKNTHPWII